MNNNEIERMIDGIIGLSSVKRFHGRSTIHIQTVSDHSCRVAQIAFFLALEFYKGDIAKANYVMSLGLFHDFPESLLGCDVSSPLKTKNGIGGRLKALETTVIKNLVEDDYLQDLMLEVADEDDHNLMKLADTLDFGLFVWEETNLGNKNFIPLINGFKTEVLKFPQSLQDLHFTKMCVSKVIS